MTKKSVAVYFDVTTYSHINFDIPSLVDLSDISSEIRKDPKTGNPIVVLYDGDDNAIASRSVNDLKIETGIDRDYGLERILEVEEM